MWLRYRDESKIYVHMVGMFVKIRLMQILSVLLGCLKISFAGFDSHVCQIVLNPFKFRYALQLESNILIPTVFSKYLLNH